MNKSELIATMIETSGLSKKIAMLLCLRSSPLLRVL